MKSADVVSVIGELTSCRPMSVKLTGLRDLLSEALVDHDDAEINRLLQCLKDEMALLNRIHDNVCKLFGGSDERG